MYQGNEKGLYETILPQSNIEDVSYEEFLANMGAKYKIAAKYKPEQPDSHSFTYACIKLYKIGKKFFSKTNYELLQKYSQFAEEITVALRPVVIKELFGTNSEIAENRLFILSVLLKHGVIKNLAGTISDDNWILFLNKIAPSKIQKIANIIAQMDKHSITDPAIFSQVKAHNNLDELEENLEISLKFAHDYDVPFTLSEDTQIKGFTLVNEFACKRTRSFPKHWKLAMKVAWEAPSVDASFELYRLYTERQTWLESFAGRPLIQNFLSYFYSKPIFKKFDAEPLTQACKLLYAAGLLNIKHFRIIANMSETGLAFCKLLNSKGVLDAQHLQSIDTVPEEILQSICKANQQQLIITPTLNMLIKLAQQNIDGTTWMVHKPNWRILAKLSENTLIKLAAYDINDRVFSNLKSIYELGLLPAYNNFSDDHRKHLLTEVMHEKIMKILVHFNTIGLLTPENMQIIFDHQERFLQDNQLLQYILNIDETKPSRNQKKFNRFMQEATQPSINPVASIGSDEPTQVILNTLPDEQLAQKVSNKLKTLDIAIPIEDLHEYTPAVLQAFYAAIPILQEEHLLTQDLLPNALRLFSSAPDPQARCRCLIVLSQCGLVEPDSIVKRILQLENGVLNKKPSLFNDIYAEAWLQLGTNPKWLERTIEAGLDVPTPEEGLGFESDMSLVHRFYIENEENSAFLALDSNKHRVARHPRPALLQQALKIVDQSKLNIESIFADLLNTNEEQIQKIHSWLTILDKSALLNPDNARLIIQQNVTLPGDLSFLKKLLTALKEQPDVKMNNLKQRTFQQLMQHDVPLQNKQKILESMHAALQASSTGEKIVYRVSDAAGESAVALQDTLKRTAEESTVVMQGTLKRTAEAYNVASAVTSKAYNTLKMFSSKVTASLTQSGPELVTLYSAQIISNNTSHDAYYKTHQDALKEDLTAMLSQGLLSEPNVKWLSEQSEQAVVGRCIRVLSAANMLKDDPHWKDKVHLLSDCDATKLHTLEEKCQRLLSSTEPQEMKEQTLQMWVNSIVQNQAPPSPGK